jgi:hypothetical protein
MPEENPDELNRLPTAADGLSHKQQLWQAQQGKARTRIGPATHPPAGESPAAPLSEGWRELFEQAATPPVAPALAEPPPLQAPRRTVIGRRAQPPEPAPPQDPTPAAPKRTIIGRRAPAPETPPAAPEAPAAPKVPAAPETSAAPEAPKKPETRESPKSSEPSETSDKSDESDKADKSEKADPAATPSRVAQLWRQYWDRWGGRALATSLAVHAVLLLSAAWIVVNQVTREQVDFLSGGGTTQGAQASQELQHRVQQKKNPWLKKPVPMRKLGVANALSELVLPDDAPDLMELPQASSLLDGGRIGGGMGLAGAGGGFGRGMGLGGRDGITFQPFSLFGMQIKARRLAVVLDVSGSMAGHLPRVLEEVDKVAKGSVAVLYYGCGLDEPPPRGLDGDGVFPTAREDFEKFWRLYGGSYEAVRKFRIDRKEAIPNEEVFRVLARRPQTYFIHNVGSSYAWLALLSDQVRSADALYWFADFQDPVNFGQIGIVRENLQARKQRLYIHAYTRGSSFDQIKTQLVEKTDGDWRLEE